MRYYYAMLALAFSLSLMLSVAHAGEKSKDQKAHTRQTAGTSCVPHKAKQKPNSVCTAKRTSR